MDRRYLCVTHVIQLAVESLNLERFEEMIKNAVVHARMDAELKAEAESILKQIGLSSAEAIRIFYKQIELNRGIPFDVKVPNKVTEATLIKSTKGEEIYQAKDADELFSELGI